MRVSDMVLPPCRPRLGHIWKRNWSTTEARVASYGEVGLAPKATEARLAVASYRELPEGHAPGYLRKRDWALSWSALGLILKRAWAHMEARLVYYGIARDLIWSRVWLRWTSYGSARGLVWTRVWFRLAYYGIARGLIWTRVWLRLAAYGSARSIIQCPVNRDIGHMPPPEKGPPATAHRPPESAAATDGTTLIRVVPSAEAGRKATAV